LCLQAFVAGFTWILAVGELGISPSLRFIGRDFAYVMGLFSVVSGSAVGVLAALGLAKGSAVLGMGWLLAHMAGSLWALGLYGFMHLPVAEVWWERCMGYPILCVCVDVAGAGLAAAVGWSVVLRGWRSFLWRSLAGSLMVLFTLAVAHPLVLKGVLELAGIVPIEGPHLSGAHQLWEERQVSYIMAAALPGLAQAVAGILRGEELGGRAEAVGRRE
jgi:hypothetical protein